MNRTPWWFFAGTSVFLLAVNTSLPGAWRNDPSNSAGGPSFALWCAGLALLCRKGVSSRLGWWVVALVAGLAGQIGSLGVLRHAALALLAASLVPTLPGAMLAAVASFSWTPAWGWIAHRLVADDLDLLRPVFCAGCLAIALIISRRSP